MTNLTQSLQEKAVKEFDKWFNHGTKDNPRFVYASGGYIEVREFVSSLVAEVVEETEKRVREEMREKAVKAFKKALDRHEKFELGSPVSKRKSLEEDFKSLVFLESLRTLTQLKEEND